MWRTDGAGLPGYGGGWFQLGNGDKALLFVTDKRRVIFCPPGRLLARCLSVAEGGRFLAALGR